MFLVGIWNLNELTTTILFIILSVFIFYAIGRIVQKRANISKTNIGLAIPIGFISYFILTWITFILFTLFETQMIMIKWVDIIKDSILMSMIIVLYRDWFPKAKQHLGSRVVVRTMAIVASLSVVFIVFFTINESYSWFSQIEKSDPALLKLLLLSSDEAIVKFSYGDNSFINALTENQTWFIYWANVTNVNQFDINNIFDYIIPTYAILITFLSINSIFRFEPSSEERDYRVLVPMGSAILTIFVLILLRDVSALSGIYMVVPVMIFIFSLISIDSTGYGFSVPQQVFGLLAGALLYTMHESGIILTLFLSIFILTYGALKKLNIVLLYNVAAVIYWIILTTFLFNLFWWSTIITTLVLLFFLAPSWSLMTNQKRKDLLKIEEKIHKNIKQIILGAFGILILTTAIISMFNSESLGLLFISFFTEGFRVFAAQWANIVLWSLISLLFIGSTIGFWLLSNSRKIEVTESQKAIALTSALFLNPVSIAVWLMIFPVGFSMLTILVPYIVAAPLMIYSATISYKNK